MPAHNSMLSDCRAIFLSFCLFSFVGFFPGYTLGWLFDLLQFRARSISFRIAASVPLSIALGPVLSYFIGRWLSLNAACIAYGILSAAALFLLAREFRFRSRPSKTQLQILAVVFIWAVIATLSLADLQIGHRVYFSIIGLDYSVRTAFTSAIAAAGLPAQTPFFFPGHPVPLRYHYFWLILPALVHHIARPLVDARQAFIGATIWCGIGVMSVTALYLRLFSPRAASGISRRSLIAILLLGITGLDILPALLMVGLAHVGLVQGISPSVEWWNDQVDGWLYTMLWEPHYLCGLIACLMGFLILWDVPRRRLFISAAAAGIAFATAVGAAIYVAFVFAIFLVLWTVVTLLKKWYRETAALALSCPVAIALCIPFLTTLRGPGSGGSPLQLTVRSFPLGEAFLKVLGFHRAWQLLLGDALLLPINYFLELGFFFAVAWIVWKRFHIQKKPATRQQLAAFMMLATSVAVCTFLKSGVIQNNDLGWRGFLIAQFILLIWAADLLPVRAGLTALLVLGAAGVVYDLAILRFFPVLSDAGRVPTIAWLANDRHLGERTYANREAYEWLRARTSDRAILQQNPNPIYQDTFYGLYSNRSTVAEDGSCATVFGGDPAECAPVLARLTMLFSSSGSFETACQTMPIDFLVAKDTDAAWRDRSSWVWTRTPLFANEFVRLFPCKN